MSVLSMTFLFIATLCLALLLSPVVIAIANKANLDDAINERSAHTTPTPRGGGLIFIFAAAIVLLVNCIHPFFIIPRSFLLILYLSFGCAVIGFLDDKFSLPSWLRFCCQILLAVYPSIHLPLLFQSVPAVLQYGLYALSWVWFINLFNFMDGTDGYAAQEAVFILFFIALVSSSLTALSIFLMASVIGFLRVNYPKASIFMGDAGSYFLGYLLFGLMIYSFTAHPHLLVPCIIVSLLFTADATCTLIRRILRKEPFLSAHRSHWYQRLYNMGTNHLSIFWFGVALNCILLLLSLLSVYFSHWIADMLISFLLITLTALWVVKKEKRAELRKT